MPEVFCVLHISDHKIIKHHGVNTIIYVVKQLQENVFHTQMSAVS